MSILDNANTIKDEVTNIGNAINNKGGDVTGKPLNEYANEISNLPLPEEPKWKDSEWVDLKSLYDNDTSSGYTYKTYCLINATDKETVLPSGFAYRTSDDTFYNDTLGHTHTWNTANDLYDSLGVPYRWVVIYSNNAISGDTGNIPNFNRSLIWVYWGIELLSGIDGEGNINNNYNLSNNYGLKAFQFAIDTNYTISNGAFLNCHSLSEITMYNDNKITTGNTSFYNCYSLQSVINVTNVGAASFTNCYSLRYIKLNDNTLNTGNNAFQDCIALQYFDNGLSFNADGLELNNSNLLCVESLLKIFNNLVDLTNEASKSIVLGTTNLDKLSASEIAIATDKNWVVT